MGYVGKKEGTSCLITGSREQGIVLWLPEILYINSTYLLYRHYKLRGGYLITYAGQKITEWTFLPLGWDSIIALWVDVTWIWIRRYIFVLVWRQRASSRDGYGCYRRPSICTQIWSTYVEGHINHHPSEPRWRQHTNDNSSPIFLNGHAMISNEFSINFVSMSYWW